MKKIIAMLGLALFSQQSMAASATVAGIDFVDVANEVITSTGDFGTNFQSGLTIEDTVADGNAASFIYGLTSPASVDLSFEGTLFDVADVDLTILFAGDKRQSGNVTLLGGTLDGSSIGFNAAPGENYTGFNSRQVTTVDIKLFGIFFDTLDLDSALSGTFADIRLDISGLSAAPTYVGLTNSLVSPVPVPAAVWLFGSGLVGLVGVARRRHS